MSMIMLLGIMVLFALVPAALITIALSARIAGLKREIEELKRNANITPVELPAYSATAFPSVMAPPIPHWNTLEHDAQLLDLIRRGEKIQAIKLYRERTGIGLKEAKEAVEDLAHRQL